ncbi:hypothetical protein M5D96_003922 [Drosophila gunungcola]|uniref:ACP54A1 n=1 Tax=Drosophila gunungcola TaxID=103775 RepID=A0A9P9YSZ6_9MUSC|nr:hypothetical protein M5D96_003922 [Drosophila gunungcola]
MCRPECVCLLLWMLLLLLLLPWTAASRLPFVAQFCRLSKKWLDGSHVSFIYEF